MTPTEVLKHEHEIILHVLGAVERTAGAIKAGGPVDADRLAKMVDFFRNFADLCHHAKEEKHLFVSMSNKGMSRESGPIAVMLHEHTEGRKLVGAMDAEIQKASSGDPRAIQSLVQAMTAYVSLLRAHIQKENNVLFPMADRILTADDQEALEAAFEKVEAEETGEGVHEKYHRLAHELAE